MWEKQAEVEVCQSDESEERKKAVKSMEKRGLQSMLKRSKEDKRMREIKRGWMQRGREEEPMQQGSYSIRKVSDEKQERNENEELM